MPLILRRNSTKNANNSICINANDINANDAQTYASDADNGIMNANDAQTHESDAESGIVRLKPISDFSVHNVGPNEMCRDIKLLEFSEQINKCYEEIVFMKKNLFEAPRCLCPSSEILIRSPNKRF